MIRCITPSSSGVLALALFASLACPTAALAQDFERVLPKAPPPQPVEDAVEPATPPTASDDQTVLVPNLQGVVFEPGRRLTDAAAGAAPAGIGAVSAQGLPPLETPEFEAQIQPYVGKPLTRAGLEAIAQLARDAYREADRPFVEVSVPQQNIASGVVRLLVTEYRVGDISVTGNRHFSTELIRGMADLEPGDTLTLPTVREALHDYNQNPFLTVNAVTSPGSETGLTDVRLEAQDRLPLRVYGGYDNQGARTLGRNEWFVGFNWGNVFGSGQTFSYQFTRSFTGGYTSHSASDVIPLNPTDSLLIYGAYAIQKPDLGNIFTSKGHSGLVSARWAHDLNDRAGGRQTLRMGADFIRTDNNLDFLGIRILDSSVDVVQFPFIYSGSFPDEHGETAVEASLTFSPGNITAHNDDASLQMLVPYADATYMYVRASATRTNFFEGENSLIVRGLFQMASANLPFSEQLAGGGFGAVRGYEPNAALGSNGLLLSSEVRSAPFSLLGLKGEFEDYMQIGLFLEYARLWQVKDFPDMPGATDLASVGVALNYQIGRHASVQLNVGQQLFALPGERHGDTRGAIVATISY